jgi:hypothetical protein
MMMQNVARVRRRNNKLHCETTYNNKTLIQYGFEGIIQKMNFKKSK